MNWVVPIPHPSFLIPNYIFFFHSAMDSVFMRS